MGKFLGDQQQLAFFYEPDTYAVGSNVGTPQWIGQVQDHSVTENPNVITIRYQGSTDRNVDAFADGNLDYDGTFTYFPQDWKFLGFAIGSISDVGSHTMSETNSDDLLYAGSTLSLPSFTLESSKNYGKAGSNFIRTYEGCMIDSYTINWSQGEIVSCEVGYMAQTGSLGSGAVIAVTPTTTKPYMFSDTQLQIPSGTVYDNLTTMSLTINNNLEKGHYLNGSRTAKELLPMNRDLELTTTFAADDSNIRTLHNHYTSGTTFNTMIQCIGTPGSVFIVLSGCKITDMTIPDPMEGLTEQSCTITPEHISAVAHDSISKYYAR